MAELLVRVADKVNPASPYEDARCLKRGDVVAACPDGWPWSELERTLPFWRIVKVPGLALDEAQALLAPEPGSLVVTPMLQRRQFKLDLDSLLLSSSSSSSMEASRLADDTRATDSLTIDVATVRALKVLKPPLADPKVIGGDPLVIG